MPGADEQITQLLRDTGLIFSLFYLWLIGQGIKSVVFLALTNLRKDFVLAIFIKVPDTTEANVRVGITGSVVQIQREGPSVVAIVPIAAADEGPEVFFD